MQRDLFEKMPVPKAYLRLALPVVLSLILGVVYNMVDTWFISLTGSPDLVAGVSVCSPVFVLSIAMGDIWGLGGSSLMSRLLGNKKDDEAGGVSAFCLYAAFGTGLLFMAAMLLFRDPILRLLGANDASFSHASAYFTWIALGTPFIIFSMIPNNQLRSEGFSSLGMWGAAAGSVANILLDPLFIFTFGMGVRGAALATILSQILSAVFVLRFLTGKKAELRLTPLKDLQALPAQLLGQNPDDRFRSTALDIAGLGSSAFVMQFTNSLVSIVCNSTLSKYGGEVMVSVYTIINSVRQVLETPVIAIGEGTSPVISYNYGARRPGHVRKAMLLMGCLGIGYTLIVWILIERFPAFFISMFSTDAALMKDAIPALHLYFFAFVFQSLQYTGQTTFKALGKKKQAIFFSLFRKVVMVVPLTLLLPGVFHFGSDGVFMAEPISNVIGGTACMTTMLLMVLPELRKME